MSLKRHLRVIRKEIKPWHIVTTLSVVALVGWLVANQKTVSVQRQLCQRQAEQQVKMRLIKKLESPEMLKTDDIYSTPMFSALYTSCLQSFPETAD